MKKSAISFAVTIYSKCHKAVTPSLDKQLGKLP